MLLGPFPGSLAVARGFVTKGELRGPFYIRLFPDVYIHRSVVVTPAVRARAAGIVVARTGGAVAGWSAAELLGASCGPWNAPAEVVSPGHLRARPGLITRQSGVHDTGYASGVRVTSPLRTAWDLARRLDLVEAVVAVDALAACGPKRPEFVPWPAGPPLPDDLRARSRRAVRSPGFDPAELLRWRADHPGARGASRLDRVVDLADPRAESPPETRLRLLLVLAGLPAPHVQYRVGHGEFRFDLAYPDARLAIEYDGDEHDDTLDRARDLRTAALGWHTLRLVSRDLTATPARTVAVVRTLLDQRRRMLHQDVRGAPGGSNSSDVLLGEV